MTITVYQCEQHRLSEQFIFENLDEILRKFQPRLPPINDQREPAMMTSTSIGTEEQHDDHQPIRQHIQRATTGCLPFGLGTMRLQRSVLETVVIFLLGTLLATLLNRSGFST